MMLHATFSMAQKCQSIMYDYMAVMANYIYFINTREYVTVMCLRHFYVHTYAFRMYSSFKYLAYFYCT